MGHLGQFIIPLSVTRATEQPQLLFSKASCFILIRPKANAPDRSQLGTFIERYSSGVKSVSCATWPPQVIHPKGDHFKATKARFEQVPQQAAVSYRRDCPRPRIQSLIFLLLSCVLRKITHQIIQNLRHKPYLQWNGLDRHAKVRSLLPWNDPT